MKLAKSVKTIICDDVRNEVGSKMSLMGVYGKDIVINQTPAVLPSLYFVIMLENVQVVFKELYINLYMPTETNPISVNYPAPTNIEKGRDINLVIGLAPFKINSAGDCRFDLAIKKDADPLISYSFTIKIGKPKA